MIKKIKNKRDQMLCFHCAKEVNIEDHIVVFMGTSTIHFCTEECMITCFDKYDPMPFSLGDEQ